MMQELYVSTDVESNGPCPGLNSMLSFGSAAFTKDKKLVSTFTANLIELPEAKQDTDTMNWWKTQPEAWENCRKDIQDPAVVFPLYVKWLKELDGKPVFVGYPATFDFLFIYYYLMKFAGESPFSFSALDIKSYAMAVMKSNFKISKKTMPKKWFPTTTHNHVALQDAIEQGELFINMMNDNLNTDKV